MTKEQVRRAIRHDKLLTVHQCAQEAQVTDNTVYRWLAKGQSTAGKEGLYPAVHISGRFVRIPETVWRTFRERWAPLSV